MKPAPEIVSLVHAITDEFNRGDFDSLARRWSRAEGVHNIGTDPAEFWIGHAGIMEILRRQREEAPDLGNRQVIERVIAFRERGIAWFAAELRRLGAENRYRMTGVVRLEAGDWHLIQLHFALAVPNEDAYGVTLTTHIEDLIEDMREERPDVHPAIGPDGTVTLMFSDIENSTVMTERLGDERWMELLRKHNAIVRDAVAANGGLEVKSQGDGFMIAFASPHAAVRAACEMHRGMRSIDLRIRIGLHRGQALVEDDDFFGKTVILAARIATKARGGETLVSEDIRRAVADGFAFGSPVWAELKGLRGSYAMHPVIAAEPT